MVARVVVRSAFAAEYDPEAVSDENGLKCEDESLAIQSQRDDADINVIVKRFGITGKLPESIVVPSYQDFAEVFDFQSAMNVVALANQEFMRLPADVRERFGNNPQKFVAFCEVPENLEELVKMGLAVKRPEPEPEKVMKVEVVSPAAPGST